MKKMATATAWFLGALLIISTGCGGDGPATVEGAGGTGGTGGAATGGVSGTGGVTASTGGTIGTAGRTGTGGNPGTGGAVAGTGGHVGTGGAAASGTGGRAAGTGGATMTYPVCSPAVRPSQCFTRTPSANGYKNGGKRCSLCGASAVVDCQITAAPNSGDLDVICVQNCNECDEWR
jgi:hypothetical protein